MTEVGVLVLTALLLALTLKSYVAEAYEIKGLSMLPTFHNGERVVVLKAFFDVVRGDVIIFTSREDPTKDLIKRVIGLPGEEIRIDGRGRVFVDDKPLAEEYLSRDSHYPTALSTPFRYVVKPGEYFVLGDNRRDSHDSRRFHGVPEGLVKGKVVVRWWPLSEVRAF
ncbi:MAG: signal peptidase I [Planctomycetes bacterium]|nr:signal peptidase I [Planctomycetota bacterium]